MRSARVVRSRRGFSKRSVRTKRRPASCRGSTRRPCELGAPEDVRLAALAACRQPDEALRTWRRHRFRDRHRADERVRCARPVHWVPRRVPPIAHGDLQSGDARMGRRHRRLLVLVDGGAAIGASARRRDLTRSVPPPAGVADRRLPHQLFRFEPQPQPGLDAAGDDRSVRRTGAIARPRHARAVSAGCDVLPDDDRVDVPVPRVAGQHDEEPEAPAHHPCRRAAPVRPRVPTPELVEQPAPRCARTTRSER